MGGFFGAVARRDIKYDVFFGVDYHSHLGTRRAGMIIHDEQEGFQRQIHSIDSTPFRTKFEKDLVKFHGNMGIGCISDQDPQPLMFRSHNGIYAICCIGAINNDEELVNEICAKSGQQFAAMSSGKVNMVDLLAALINEKKDFREGILYAQEKIKGSATILIMTEDRLIAARDSLGRLPVLIGKHEVDGYCVSFESFAYIKQGYQDCYELGPGEIVEITADGFQTISPAGDQMKICTFLWTYYGYPNSYYENQNVEMVRYRNGAIMARDDAKRHPEMDVDYVCGMPDSGIPHAIGYANESHKDFARPFIKYTPTWLRSFTPPNQEMRNQVAKMKQIHVPALIKDKKLLLVDDSIVRGTQLRETVDFLKDSGVKEVHMRSACPPIMHSCKYLNFSRSTSDMDLISRRVIVELEGEEGLNHIEEYADGNTERGKAMRKKICEKFKFASLGFQTVDGVINAIGIEPCKLCTYCWNGKE
jgi:amidophosphoribosyltransferase